MAARKLQAEIDRTLKQVDSGVEVFESTFEKLGMATNATQKDKLETDLKTQIKKLQRMRDTIKNWLGSSDIKDKTSLMDHRKLIESQMERFKALEKEMKMKAFSKEGLIAQSKLDPAEKAKRDVIDWVGMTIDEISRQVEQTEAEMEAVQGGGGKKKKGVGEKMSELEELNERRVWHNSKLEIVQRMLENGQLTVDDIEVIQEDIKYFVEANAEEDFDFDDGIYEDLNLQEEDEFFGENAHNDDISNLDSSSMADPTEASSPPPAPAPALVAKTPAKEDKKEKPSSTIKTSTPGGASDEPPSPVQGKKQTSRKSTMDSTKAEPMIISKATPKTPAAAAATEPAATPSSSVPAPAPVPKAALPAIRYAAAVAGPATAAATAAAAATGTPATVAPTSSHDPASPTTAKTELPIPDLTPAVSEPPQHEKELALPPTGFKSPPPATDAGPTTNGHPAGPPPGLTGASSPAPSSLYQTLQNPFGGRQGAPSPVNQMATQQAQPQQQQTQRGESSRAGSLLTSPRAAHGVMGNLMQNFDQAKESSERRAGDLNELHHALDGSFNNAPSQLDAEPPRYYHPKNPIKTPSHYPQSRPPYMKERSFFHNRLEIDQLFYIFYYCPGTFEQWVAAEELKHLAWRFHKQYLTWFQRAHNPTAITDDYEQGGYLYFDWENSWCQRRKTDFRFEYRWLSDH